MSLKILVTGTGKDGTSTIADVIGKAYEANGESAVVVHEPDIFLILDTYRQFLETGEKKHRKVIADTIRGWKMDVAVSAGLDFCLDIFHEVYGPGLKVMHVKREKESYLDSVMHSTKGPRESHGNYMEERKGEPFKLYRPAAFHFSEKTKKEWAGMSTRERYGWYYDKIHSLNAERVKLFKESLQLRTEDLSKPETLEAMTRFINPAWTTMPEAVHRNHLRLFNYDALTENQRLWCHEYFTGFDIDRLVRSPIYAVNHFFRYVDIKRALEEGNPEVEQLLKRVAWVQENHARFLERTAPPPAPAAAPAEPPAPANSNWTFFVRTDGNDQNNGLTNTPSGGLRTIQRAIDLAVALDTRGAEITIQVGDGTYTSPTAVGPIRGTSGFRICGNAADPSSVVIHTTNASCISISGGARGTPFLITDLTVRTTDSGNGITATDAALIGFKNVVFGPCADSHLHSQSTSRILILGDYAITGGARRHFQSIQRGTIERLATATITLKNKPAFSGVFAQASQLGLLTVWGLKFSGTAKGARYYVETNAVIYTNSGGADYFPGNAPGSIASGGQYA